MFKAFRSYPVIIELIPWKNSWSYEINLVIRPDSGCCFFNELA